MGSLRLTYERNSNYVCFVCLVPINATYATVLLQQNAIFNIFIKRLLKYNAKTYYVSDLSSAIICKNLKEMMSP